MNKFFILLLIVLVQNTWAAADKNPLPFQRTFQCQMKVSDKNEVEVMHYEIYGCGKSGPAQVVLWKDNLEPIKFMFPAKCTQDGKSILDPLKIEFDTDCETLTVDLKKRDDDIKNRRSGSVTFKGKKVVGTTECLVKY